tara:strand:- start:595 stop:972 length:378 start_codon:yes stop_codon:yes gene_type:complete
MLVFADKIYFKNDTSIEGKIIDYKGDYITFKLDSINDVQYPLGSVIKMIDSQTIQFSMEYVYMVTDSDGEIIATRTGQDELLTKWESKTPDKIKKTKFNWYSVPCYCLVFVVGLSLQILEGGPLI